MEVLGLDHVVLRVSDAERMIRFYCDVLGCTVERQVDSLGLFQLRAGRSLIDLVSVDGEIGRAGGAAAGKEVLSIVFTFYVHNYSILKKWK